MPVRSCDLRAFPWCSSGPSWSYSVQMFGHKLINIMWETHTTSRSRDRFNRLHKEIMRIKRMKNTGKSYNPTRKYSCIFEQRFQRENITSRHHIYCRSRSKSDLVQTVLSYFLPIYVFAGKTWTWDFVLLCLTLTKSHLDRSSYLSNSWLLSHLKTAHNQKPARSIFLLNQVNMTLTDISVVAHCGSSKAQQGTGCVWNGVWRMQVIHEPICAKCLLVTRWWAWDIQTFSYSMESAELMREQALSNVLFTGPLVENAWIPHITESKTSTDSLHKWRNGRAKQCSTEEQVFFELFQWDYCEWTHLTDSICDFWPCRLACLWTLYVLS